MDFHFTELSIADQEFRHLVHFVCKCFSMVRVIFKSNVIDFQAEGTILLYQTGRCDAKTRYARTDQLTLCVLDASLAREEKFRKWNLQAIIEDLIVIFSLR